MPDETTTTLDENSPSTPAPRRRRSAGRAAGPPLEGDSAASEGTPGNGAVADTSAAADADVSTESGPATQKPRRARTQQPRRSRSAQQPAAPAEVPPADPAAGRVDMAPAAADVAPADSAQPDSSPADSAQPDPAQVGVAPADAGMAPARRRRSTRSRQAADSAPPAQTVPAAEPVAAAASTSPQDAVASQDAVAPADGHGTGRPPARRRRKATAPVIDVESVDVVPVEVDVVLMDAPSADAPLPDTQPADARPADEQSSRRSRRSALVAVTFQAPDPAAVELAPRRPRRVASAPAGPAAEITVSQDPDLLEELDLDLDADADDLAPGVVGDISEELGDDDDGGSASSRRRRRGRRGRGRTTRPDEDGTEVDSAALPGSQPAVTGDDAEQADDDSEDDAAATSGGGRSASTRRRRRRRRGGPASPDDGASDGSPDDPPVTVVHVREPRSRDDDLVRGVSGSTRLEAKRQRRREGRDSGRRRPPIVTEAEFLTRRESVERVMVVRNAGERTQIAVLEDGVLVEHFVTRASSTSYAGNVYLGRVQNVLASMEAAFVDIGKGRNAVLYAGEVNYDASALDGRPRKIEQALKSGQPIVVQVSKDPIGHKGARLTSQVSLPGRYMVYVPDGQSAGISRKLPDTERTRLKAILKKITPEDGGVIVRTAAEGASEEELSRDIARLAAQWEEIQKKSAKATAPSLLYSEPDLVIRVIRDIFNEDFSALVVQGDSEWDMIESYVDLVADDLRARVRRHTGTRDVFAEYRVDEQLAKALDRKVWLPSGGSLVIDRTEAMTVIDVNTGKFTGKGGNLEETVTKNNLEAAEEIVRQLRLRDIGGIIVIDFIDMVLESNRDLVLRRLTECLGRDRTRHQVAEVTSLGLVQMTRKRVGSGLLEAYSEPCTTCNGRGVIVHLDTQPSYAKPVPRPPIVDPAVVAGPVADAPVASEPVAPEPVAPDPVAAEADVTEAPVAAIPSADSSEADIPAVEVPSGPVADVEIAPAELPAVDAEAGRAASNGASAHAATGAEESAVLADQEAPSKPPRRRRATRATAAPEPSTDTPADVAGG